MIDKSIKKHLESIMPGMEVVEENENGPVSDADVENYRAAGPSKAGGDVVPGKSIEELRSKYLGNASADKAPKPPTSDSDDLLVAEVRPKTPHADPVHEPGKRTIIFSRDKGKITGMQG